MAVNKLVSELEDHLKSTHQTLDHKTVIVNGSTNQAKMGDEKIHDFNLSWQNNSFEGVAFQEGTFVNLNLDAKDGGFFFDGSNFEGDIKLQSNVNDTKIPYTSFGFYDAYLKLTFRGCTFTNCEITLNGYIGFEDCDFINSNLVDDSSSTNKKVFFDRGSFQGESKANLSKLHLGNGIYQFTDIIFFAFYDIFSKPKEKVKTINVAFTNCRNFTHCQIYWDLRGVIVQLSPDKIKKDPKKEDSLGVIQGGSLTLLDSSVPTPLKEGEKEPPLAPVNAADPYTLNYEIKKCNTTFEKGFLRLEGFKITLGWFSINSGRIWIGDSKFTGCTVSIKSSETEFYDCIFSSKEFEGGILQSIKTNSTKKLLWNACTFLESKIESGEHIEFLECKINHCLLKGTSISCSATSIGGGSLDFLQMYFKGTPGKGPQENTNSIFQSKILHKKPILMQEDGSILGIENTTIKNNIVFSSKRRASFLLKRVTLDRPDPIPKIKFEVQVGSTVYEKIIDLNVVYIKKLANSLLQKFRAVKRLLTSKEPPHWDFSSIQPEKDSEYIFIDCELLYADFYGWDLRDTDRINIKDCSWNIKDYSKLAKHDHYVDKGNELEGMYRALKNRYEEEANKPQSGDFHYWEQVLRRKRLSWFNPETWLLFPYAWLSGYGEKLFRMFIVWWIILLGTPFAVSFCSFGWSLKHYLDTLLTSLLVLVPGTFKLLHENSFVHWGNSGRFIFLVGAILFAIQTTLLVLGVRRRMLR